MTNKEKPHSFYTLIFEDKKGNAESLTIQGILMVFNQIKINLTKVKSKNLKLTLIKNEEYLFEPKDTNVLIQIVKDYYKFIDDKLALIRTAKKGEVLVFNTGNSEWVDTDIIEALKRPCDKTTKLLIVNKKDLIEVSKKHTLLGIYKIYKI
jgi:hypothetical protein